MRHVAHKSANINKLLCSSIIWFGLLRGNFFVRFFVWHVAGVQGSAPQTEPHKKPCKRKHLSVLWSDRNNVGLRTHLHICWRVLRFIQDPQLRRSWLRLTRMSVPTVSYGPHIDTHTDSVQRILCTLSNRGLDHSPV